MMLNTRPIGLMFKQHPRDPANVNCGLYIADQTEHLADVFVRENVAYGYDVLTTL